MRQCFNRQTQFIMKRCESLQSESKDLLQQIRTRSNSLAYSKTEKFSLKENIQLHNYLESQIISTAKNNQKSAKYVKKQLVSSHLSNPVYYNKLLTGVTKKRMSLQSIASKQFCIQQERSIWKIVKQTDFHGFQ